MRIKALGTVIVVGLLITTFSLFNAAAIDTPHSASNNVSCGSCHGAALLNSPFWGGTMSYDQICLNCHRASSGPYTDTNAPLVKTHSSLNTSNKYGDWTRECRNCHDPHYQKQKNYKNTDAGNLYLATGTITSSPPPSYNPTENKTTLYYSSITYKSGWNVAKLTNKTEDYRRTILFPNVNKLGYNYPVIAVDTIAKTITVTGNATAYLYPPTTFAAIYGQYIKDFIDVSGTLKAVKFLDKASAKSFADGDGTYDGVCEVCHTQTQHFRNAAGAPDQNHTNIGSGIPGTNCISCHPHLDGFKASCNSCHGYPPTVNTTTPPNGLMWVSPYTGSTTAGAHSLHATSSGRGYLCDTCHYQNITQNKHNKDPRFITLGFYMFGGAYQGGSYDGQASPNYDATTTIPSSTVSKTGLKECSNIYCHGSTMAPNGGTDTTPIWDNPATGACGTCHGATAASPPVRGSHSTHTRAYLSGYNYSCGLCHKDPGSDASLHVNNKSEVVFSTDPKTTGGSYNGTDTMLDAYGTCTNVYCHGNYPGGKNASPTWGGTAPCGSCHRASNYEFPNGGSHNRHTSMYSSGFKLQRGYSCLLCHKDIVGGTGPLSYTIIDKSKHVNGYVDWKFDTTDPRISASSAYSIPSGTAVPSDGTTPRAYGTCSNVYCHSNVQPNGGVGGPSVYTTPQWGTTFYGINCDLCHIGGHWTPISTGSHPTHLNYTFTTPENSVKCVICHKWNAGAALNDCRQCHYPATGEKIYHVNGFVDVLFDPTFGNAIYNGTPAPGDGYGSCSNTYCHSNGTSVSTGTVPANTSPNWGTGTLACNACHGNPPDYPNGSPKANSHLNHSSYGCNACHVNTTSGGTTITNTSNHVNKAYNVDPGSGESFTYTFAPAGGTCADISCHGNTSTQWGKSGCACHYSTVGTRRQVLGAGGDFNKESHHVINYDSRTTEIVTDADCRVCHDMGNHMSGTIKLKNKDTAETIVYEPSDPTTLETFCLSCHDANGANGDMLPFSSTNTLGTVPNRAGTEIKSSWDKVYGHRRKGITCMGDGKSAGCHGNYNTGTGLGSINAHGSNNVGILANKLTLPIPQSTSWDETNYTLCLDCHKNYPTVHGIAKIVGNAEGSNYGATGSWPYYVEPFMVTGFHHYSWNTNNDASNQNNLHRYHLAGVTQWLYRGDTRYGVYGTFMNCVSCHNVHGVAGQDQHYLWDEWGFSIVNDSGVERGRVAQPMFPETYPSNCSASCHWSSQGYQRSPFNEAKAVASNGTGIPGVLDNGDTVTIYFSDSTNGQIINETNIGSVLQLCGNWWAPGYGGDQNKCNSVPTWTDSNKGGAPGVLSADWSSTDGKTNNVLTITLFVANSPAGDPTIAPGSYIFFHFTPDDGITKITDVFGNPVTGAMRLRGSF